MPENFASQRRAALLRAAATAASRHGDGLQRRVELDRPDPAARGRRGLIGRFGALDATDGGSSTRYSLSATTAAAGRRRVPDRLPTAIQLPAGPVLQLHLLPRRPGQRRPVPADRPAQRLRLDRRIAPDRASCSGGHDQHVWAAAAPRPHRPGRACIDRGARDRLATPRGQVGEAARPLRSRTRRSGTTWFRSVLGLRCDRYRFDVSSACRRTRGEGSTPASYRPSSSSSSGRGRKTEYFVNAGYGFHSNDARGTTITVDPTTGAGRPAHAAGAHQGRRAGRAHRDHPQPAASLALWHLELDSELVFVGDAGTTEAGRPAGAKASSGQPLARPAWLLVDLDLASPGALHRRRSGGRLHPGALDRVASVGVTVPSSAPGRARCSCATSARAR